MRPGTIVLVFSSGLASIAFTLESALSAERGTALAGPAAGAAGAPARAAVRLLTDLPPLSAPRRMTTAVREVGRREQDTRGQRGSSAVPAAEAEAAWAGRPGGIRLPPHPAASWEGPAIGAAGCGGAAEPSVVYLPHSRKLVLFYSGVDGGAAPDWTGATRHDRIGRAECEADAFDAAPRFERTPAAGPDSYVFDPARHGMRPGETYGSSDATAVWGTAYVPLHAHVSRNPADGILHMVALGAQPSTDRDTQDRSRAIGHWWSADEGFTWIGDRNNPLVTLQDVSARATPPAPGCAGGGGFGSPRLVWDGVDGKVSLVFGFGCDVSEDAWPFACEARLPSPTSETDSERR